MKKEKRKVEPLKTGDDKPVKLTYPPEEDIYTREAKVDGLNPDDGSQITEKNDYDDAMNEKDFKDDISGDDLDVPGSELDDKEEANGEEDEENNYYSLPDNK